MSSASASICALILAAGYSTRMHAFKPLLPFGNGSVLAHVADVWRAAGARDIVVVAGYRGHEVETEARRLGLACVQNPAPEHGMFSSIQVGLTCCLRHSTAQWFGVQPVDIPLISPATIRALLAVCTVTNKDLVKPAHGQNNGHPPMIRRSAVPGILAHSGNDGLRGALRRLSLERVEVQDEQIDMDMDTQEDYSRALALLAQREDSKELYRSVQAKRGSIKERLDH